MTVVLLFFFFNDTATTEIYTLSLHDALPILRGGHGAAGVHQAPHELAVERNAFGGPPPHRLQQGRHRAEVVHRGRAAHRDRKSTRLNSSHANISYAVFCLKKKKIS